MARSNPRLIIDTSVFSEAVKKSVEISPEDWTRTRKVVHQKYDYRISYITYLELAMRLGRCKPTYFEQNKRAFDAEYITMGKTRPIALEKPFFVAAQKVFKQNLAPADDADGFPIKTVPKQVPDVIRAIRMTPDKEALKQGVLINRKDVITFDLDNLDHGEYGPMFEHVELLKEVRNGSIAAASRLELAAQVLLEIGFGQSTVDQQNRFADAIDAACRYALFLLQLTNDHQYKFESPKHKGDWADIQQLMYLADPQMHLLTLDKPLATHRTNGSPQQNRIILWSDFVKS